MRFSLNASADEGTIWPSRPADWMRPSRAMPLTSGLPPPASIRTSRFCSLPSTSSSRILVEQRRGAALEEAEELAAVLAQPAAALGAGLPGADAVGEAAAEAEEDLLGRDGAELLHLLGEVVEVGVAGGALLDDEVVALD